MLFDISKNTLQWYIGLICGMIVGEFTALWMIDKGMNLEKYEIWGCIILLLYYIEMQQEYRKKAEKDDNERKDK